MGLRGRRACQKLADQTFLFFGAGQANIGAAQLLTLALAQQGLSAADARSRIWLMDSQVRPRPDFQQYPACLLPLVKGGNLLVTSSALSRTATLPDNRTLSLQLGRL